MWTNIFRIGELQTVSWFQFLPLDTDLTSLSDKNAKAEQKDAANYTVISAHLQLQKEGFLTTWTNSFVGPWDPSQGAHNPDEKIKLWLFIPGRNTSLSESAQSAVSKLRVIANGVWISPGDSEEVSLALSQALRNTLERAMRGLSYVRFGDVFAKNSHSGQSERSLRKARTTVEFIFAATEEAVYVHAIISAKYVRSLCGDDIEKILIHSSNSSSDGLPVIVAPNGMLGRLTGCCPSELVKKVYTSKIKGSNGAPYVNQSPGCQMRGQSFYVEIALGCTNNNNNIPFKEAKDKANTTTTAAATTTNINNNMERTFIFPPESVLIPMMHRAFSRFSSKRFWIQNGTETSLSETWPFWNFSGPSFIEHCLAVGTTCHVESSRNSSCLRLKRHYRNNNNNNNSGSSSVSSVSSTSSEEADVDSTASKQNNKGVKRTHGETLEAGKPNNNNILVDLSDSNRGPVWAGGGLNEDDELAGFEVQTVLFEFGDFGDFFENDLYGFGDPPGTAEPQALTLPSTDLGEITTTSPLLEMMPDQHLTSPVSVPSVPTFPSPVPQIPHIPKSPQPIKHLIPFSKQNVQLSKAEAVLTFAPEYAAVEFGGTGTETEGLNSSVFRNPYRPSVKKTESCNSSSSYVYGAAPPPAGADSDENRKASSKLYTLVQNRNAEINKPSVIINSNDDGNGSNNNVEVSDMSGVTSLSTSNNNNMKKNENTVFDASNLILPSKLSLATDIDCIMHQATMCKTRHTRLSLKSKQLQNQPQSQLTIKKENIPVRIGGDLDPDLTTDRTPPVATNQVGVWRSVSGPKPIKQNDEGTTANVPTRNPLMDFLVGLGLLVQNSASFVDLGLDGVNGEGPYSWIALEEQKQRGFACEPEMCHAGCGGLLASCHSLDLAGVDLVDPLNADVSVPAVMSLLQSDIKHAMKSAFGASSDGPLSVVDWCKGRGAHDGPTTTSTTTAADPYSFLNDSSSGATVGGADLSPPLSTSTSSSHRDGQRRSNQDSSNSEQEQDKGFNSRSRPTLAVLPTPSILVGYQDDWLKASVNCVQLWEKAPLEPYALPKPVSYYAICPDIELLTTAAVDFFQQLGTVYELCKLGTHAPYSQLDASSSKPSSPGLVLLEAPQQLKPPKPHFPSLTSISEYFLSLSKHWTPKSFLASLSKLLKTLKLSPHSPSNPKESSGSPTTVVYVICPFPEPSAILQTLVESSVALGTAVLSPSEKDKKYLLHSQVSRSLNPNPSIAGEDLLSSSSSLTLLSGFSHPKLVLQIISIETLLKLSSPSLNELSILKDIAFTVYTKSRRVTAKPLLDPVHHSSFPTSRSQMMHHMTSAGSHVPGLWKDCLVPRALNARDSSDFDPTYNTWQRNNMSSVPTSLPDPYSLEDKKYLFEPLFILAEPGSLDHSPSTLSDAASEGDSPNEPSPASLHCCYGWTEDWRWFVCIWTDSRGELLDSFIFPFGGISGRQDTKVLQGLFVQVLQQGCQIAAGSCGNDGAGIVRPRDVVIARLGGFFELECQEWQKAIYSIGGNEVRKWPIQLRQGLNPNPNPNSSQDSTFLPASSPNPSSLYSSKSGFMKGGPGSKKPLADSSRGAGSALNLMQSITLVAVSVDHSLRLILPAESAQSASGTTTTTTTTTTTPTHLEGFTSVKSLGAVPSSYLLIPSPNLKPLSPSPLRLPTCLTSLSPPLAHLLHSQGSAVPIASCYVASRSVPPIRKDLVDGVKDDWPSVLSVGLVDYYGGGRRKGGEEGVGREVMESVGAELSGLSWLTVSPVYGERRSVLPFHCEMVGRMRRVLCYAERELEKMNG